MKTETQNYIIAGLYLAILLTLVVAALYLDWHNLLYLVALCLAGYGAYKLLAQTDIGQKMLELVFVAPLLLFCITISIAITLYPLGALLGWWPWLYINDLPVYGSEIFQHPGSAVFVLGIEAFWGVTTIVLIIAWKKSWDGERGS